MAAWLAEWHRPVRHARGLGPRGRRGRAEPAHKVCRFAGVVGCGDAGNPQASARRGMDSHGESCFRTLTRGATA